MSDRLRVALVTHLYPTDAEPSRGLAVYHHFQEFAKLADVSVYCVMPDYPDVRFLGPRTFQVRKAKRLGSTCPGAIVRYPTLPWVTRPLNGWNCARSLTPHLRQTQPDIVLATFLYPDGYAAVTCARKLGIPVIVEGIGSDLRRVKGFWARRLTKQTIHQANYLTTVSAELRRRAISEFDAEPQKVRVRRQGCDPSIFRLTSRTAARQALRMDLAAELIVFVGRLVEIKGLRELLAAIPRLIARRPQVQVACVGEGPLLRDLQTAARQSGIQDRVMFPGALPPVEVAKWIAASNLVCLPSHSEGLPNIVIEALACGRPVVASDVGGIPELIDSGCGVLTPPQNPERLAQALEQCLTTRWDEEAIAQRFQRSWKESAREHFELCLEVLHRCRTGERAAILA
jgi:glycosyltransferase involved in cell wall biosynthesis